MKEVFVYDGFNDVEKVGIKDHEEYAFHNYEADIDLPKEVDNECHMALTDLARLLNRYELLYEQAPSDGVVVSNDSFMAYDRQFKNRIDAEVSIQDSLRKLDIYIAPGDELVHLMDVVARTIDDIPARSTSISLNKCEADLTKLSLKIDMKRYQKRVQHDDCAELRYPDAKALKRIKSAYSDFVSNVRKHKDVI